MAKAAAPRVRKKERKNIISGVAHVLSTFNNTMITISDAQGNAIAWSSSGSQGCQGICTRNGCPPRDTPLRRAWLRIARPIPLCGPLREAGSGLDPQLSGGVELRGQPLE